MPSLAENKALARRFLEAQAKGDMETLDKLMAPDFVDRSLLPGQKPDRKDYKQSLADMLSVYSNTSFTVADLLVMCATYRWSYDDGETQAWLPQRKRKPHRHGPGAPPTLHLVRQAIDSHASQG